MDVFRFEKLAPRPNDPTRRYRLVRNVEREAVGDVEIGGDAPAGNTLFLAVACHPILSDAARADALAKARRFLDELVSGWGRQITEAPEPRELEEQADGTFRARLEYRVG